MSFSMLWELFTLIRGRTKRTKRWNLLLCPRIKHTYRNGLEDDQAVPLWWRQRGIINNNCNNNNCNNNNSNNNSNDNNNNNNNNNCNNNNCNNNNCNNNN